VVDSRIGDWMPRSPSALASQNLHAIWSPLALV